jgi:hypothetical protein
MAAPLQTAEWGMAGISIDRQEMPMRKNGLLTGMNDHNIVML